MYEPGSEWLGSKLKAVVATIIIIIIMYKIRVHSLWGQWGIPLISRQYFLILEMLLERAN